MKGIKKNTQVNNPNIRAVLIGVVVSLLTTLVLAAISAWLIGKGTMTENRAELLSVVIVLISTVVGCISCNYAINDKILLHSLICGVAFFATLVSINIVAFKGEFDGLPGKLIAVIGAAVLCGLIRGRSLMNSSKRKFRMK